MITSKRKPVPVRETLPLRAQRVVDDLTRRINQGRLKPGDQIPTLRELGRAFEVSYGVIHAALQQLEKNGLVHKVHGSGTYVKERDPAKISSKSSTEVYILIHNVRAGFTLALDALVCAIQDRGLTPIPVAFDRFQPKRVEQLIGRWHETPPRAVLVRGATRQVAEMVQKHSPAATRFIVIYNLADGTNPHWHCVRPDEFKSYQLAAQYLIQQGHRRIGLPVSIYKGMTQTVVQTYISAKTSGIRQAFAEAGLEDGLIFHEKLIQHDDTSAIGLTAENVLRMARWLTEEQHCTAVIESTFRMPCVLAAAREAGLRVGQDLALVGVGDPTPAKQGEYPCVSEEVDETCRHVMAMIFSDDEDFDRVGRQVIVPPVFVPQWRPSKDTSIDAKVDTPTHRPAKS